MIVSTTRLLKRCQLGRKTGDPDVAEAARCCLSYLIPHLWEEVISLPAHMVPLYNVLPEG